MVTPGPRHHKISMSKDGKPQAGSFMREMYDLFTENPGAVINIRPYRAYRERCKGVKLDPKEFSGTISRLNDHYRLEVRSFGNQCYMLIGEYDQKANFTDYNKLVWEGQFRVSLLPVKVKGDPIPRYLT